MSKFLSVALLFFLTIGSSRVQAGVIFSTNASWKLLKGRSEASSPDAGAWRAIGFDDSGWTSTPAPFWYGDVRAGGTQLADMQNSYSSFFLRRTFVLTNLSGITSLRLTALIDDGFIAWVNGTEVQRVNMAVGAFAYNALASTNQLVDPAVFNNYDLTSPAPSSYLVVGTNVLAVQVFNTTLSSSDIGFETTLSSNEPDSTAPAIASLSPPPGTVSALTNVTVTFSEPVQGVNASDLLINGAPATGMSGGNDTYTFTFAPQTFGTVQISWAVSHGITDYAPAPLAFDATAPSATWTYTIADVSPPVVTSTAPPVNSTIRSLTQIEVLFSEPVTGVDVSDLLINGSPATGLTNLSTSRYVFVFPATPVGTVQVAWSSSHGIQDLASTPNNFAGGSWTYTVDPNALSTVRINEFAAANLNGLRDEDNTVQDWLELYNFGSNTVSLAGWSLTDDPSLPNKWIFPSVSILPQKLLVVFCSGKDRKPTTAGSKLHTNFKLDPSGEYLGLYNSDTPQQAISVFDPYPEQRNNYSYGYDSSNQLRYFQFPSPGTNNPASSITNIVGDTKFSHTRGFYDTNFSLTITCATPGVSIRFTTNGSAPTASSGFIYTNALPITNTTVLRAAAFKAGALPSDVDTHSYVFVRDVVRQPDATVPGPGWPTANSAAGQYYDFGMDPNVANVPPYNATLQSDLKSIPSFSIVMDLNDLFNPSTDPAVGGIYANPRGDSIQWERPGSIELIYPDDSQGFHINGGVRIRGGYSRDGSNPKHAFRFFFRQDYGDSTLKYPIFGSTGPSEFNKFDLRTFENYSWSFGGDPRFIALRDQFSRDAQLAMGQQGERGDFFHLYINGEYWGLYNTDERAEANFGSFYYGGSDADYDTIKVSPDDGYIIYATDGTMDAWTRLFNQAVAGFANDADYQKVQGLNLDGTPNPAYENLLDVDNLIDYMFVIFYGGNLDAPISNFLGNSSPNNFFAIRDRAGTHGGFRFIAHDSEHTLLNVNEDRTGPYVAGDPAGGGGLLKSNPQYFFQQLWVNAEFRTRVGDRAQKHFLNGGALSPEAALGRFLVRSNQIYQAVNAESARWGDSKREPALTRTDWLNEIGNVARNFLPQRTAVVLNQLRSKNLFPTNSAPIFNQAGGSVPSGFSLIITNPNANSTVWYTLDGTDPRLRGGAISPVAQAYSVPIVINTFVNVRARVRSGTNWSAITEAVFYTQQDFTRLQVTEIMYNPPAVGAISGDEFEFLELKNTGTNVLSLSGLHFTAGITFTFTNGTTLAPGQFFVLGRNAAQLQSKYPGLVVKGIYTGKLDNGGEALTLTHPLGGTLLSVTYNDTAPWPITADGSGFSLVPLNSAFNPNPDNGINWRASSSIGGSPGADDPAPTIPRVVINEILTHSVLPQIDKIELYNPSGAAVNIGGWFLTDDAAVPTKFRIPDNTMIGAGSYLVFDESQFNPTPGTNNSFSLSAEGEEIYLLSGNAATNLTGYSYGFGFGAAAAGVSFGRYVISTGEEQFPAQVAQSFGVNNVGPKIGPVVINEIQYNPAFGDDEFIELRNITGAAVSLFDAAIPTNTWKVNGLGFDFPTNTVLGSNALLLLVATDPAAFRAKYGVAPSVQVLGPYVGSLQNDGERLELQRPDNPVTNAAGQINIPYITVDEVRFGDRLPWPSAADGGGSSLQRWVSQDYGNDPINWFAAGLTPGGTNFYNYSPPRVVRQPTNQVVNAGVNVSFVVGTTNNSLPLVYQWSFNGASLSGATNATLTITNVQASQAGSYGATFTDGVTFFTSATAILTVNVAPVIVVPPQNMYGAAGSNVTFTVTASGSLPMTYEWRKVSTPLTNFTLYASNASFTLFNLKTTDAGNYRVIVSNSARPSGTPSVLASLTVVTNGNSDPDGDGMNNLQEAIAGTDPNNAQSYLRIDSAGAVGGGTVLTFNAVSNRSYSVQYRESFSTPGWVTLTSFNSAATNRTIIFTNAPPGVPGRYYRLLTPQAP